jgi:hypothetical protein
MAIKKGRQAQESDDEYEEEEDGIDVSTDDHIEVDGSDSDKELVIDPTCHQPSKAANEVFDLDLFKVSESEEETVDAAKVQPKGKRVKGRIERAPAPKTSKQKSKVKKGGVIETDSEHEVEVEDEYCPKTCGMS